MAVLLLSPVLAACTISRTYRGLPLRGDSSELVEGQSTRGDVLRLLGPPERITHQNDGDAFMYAYRRQNYSSITIREPIVSGQTLFTYTRQFDMHDRIVVIFDFTGVVRNVAVERETQSMPRL